VDAVADFLSTGAATVLAGVFGALWGSFFNVVIARLPRGESVVHPGSRCFACGTPVRPWDNIPILSYFLLRGRCRHCGARFSIRYALVEALTAVLAAAIFWKVAGAGAGLDMGQPVAVRLGRFALYFTFAGALIVLAFIDIDTKRLPDVITLPGIAVFFLGAFAAHDVSWKERAIGIAAGYLFFRLIADFYYYVLKREGLGLGDGKLFAMIGAVFGWRALPIVLFVASILGSVVSIPILVASRKNADAPSLRRIQVPFGPFLAAGALVYLFAGAAIWGLLLAGD